MHKCIQYRSIRLTNDIYCNGKICVFLFAYVKIIYYICVFSFNGQFLSKNPNRFLILSSNNPKAVKKHSNMKDRIQKILTDKKMTPSRFADEVGLNRPAVSHILNGRNNPGLDALQRIIARFTDINAAWLISGAGPMYNSSQDEAKIPFLFDESAEIPTVSLDRSENPKENALKSSYNMDKGGDNQINNVKNVPSARVKKIAVFYSDNTYQEFVPTEKQ